jgi:hypothetical protein
MAASEGRKFKLTGRHWALLILLAIGWLGSAAWGHTAPKGTLPTYSDLTPAFLAMGALFVVFYAATVRLSEARFGRWIATGVYLTMLASNLVYGAIAQQKGYNWMHGALFPFLGASAGWQFGQTYKLFRARRRTKRLPRCR